ncbi:MAG: monovalent cation/H+ antiporter subunit D, partial [Pseudomonadota bacterium]|nr:monovalent cation/H+ antiporter subunit D [Pseudomonadota bacterium]
MTAFDHLIVAPIVIPAVTAAVALLVMRRRRRLGAALSLAGCVAGLLAAVARLVTASDDEIRVNTIG